MFLDAKRVVPPRVPGSALLFRLRVAMLNMIQPLARVWGRGHGTAETRRENSGFARPLPGPPQKMPGGVVLLPLDRPRAQLAAAIVKSLRDGGFTVLTGTGWESYDASLRGSMLIGGELVTTAHPEGSCQLRVRKCVRPGPARLALAVTVAAFVLNPLVAAGVAVLAAADIARGLWRVGPGARRTVVDASERRRVPRDA